MKKLLVVPVLALTAVMLAPMAQAGGDDVYPPVVPGSNALGTAGYAFHIAAGGDPAEICVGRFVLRGSCEVHGVDVQSLSVAGHTDGVPTGNGDEWHREMDIRAYDLNADGQLIFERHCEYTWPQGNAENAVTSAVEYNLVGPWTCSDFYGADSAGPMDIRVEVEANGAGTIWAQVQ